MGTANVYPRKLTGTCSNGAERNKGRLTHAILAETEPANYGFETAACGAVPGRRSVGWESYGATEVTCEKCLKRLAKLWPPATTTDRSPPIARSSP